MSVDTQIGAEIFVVLAYLLVVVFLGWLGYVRTTTAADYLIAGRKVHPFVMALSYGATFISTSAIVGFGGVAGLFGMSVLWLTVCNIFVGIFIAFVFLAPAARRLGHHLDAHTFPELLGRRYQSRFIQIFAGLVIFLFIPLYAAAVLIGACKFIATQFHIDYEVALLIFSIIIAAYVVVGGLKGVMYSDALQGSIMFVGMLVLLIYTYYRLGGITDGHNYLGTIAPLAPGGLQTIGHRGWSAMPAFGWGNSGYNLWWTVISNITLGVGIGVLAQPQLVVRFMTVKSKRELNRAVPTGGLFILIMTGVAFTVGALSNAYFTQYGEPFTGRVLRQIGENENHALLQLMEQDPRDGQWYDVPDKQVPVVLSGEVLATASIMDEQQTPVVTGRSISVVYAGGDFERIIPTFVRTAMPKWFGFIFLLTLLSAAMSTLSSQFHAVGTSIGRDVYEQVTKSGRSIAITRTGVVVGIFVAVLWSYFAADFGIIASATALFFGLCASTFLPSFVGGLFLKWMTRTGAIASMISGFSVTMFWLLFVKQKEAGAIGLVQRITDGKNSIFWNRPNWPEVDPILIALPISIIVMLVVSLATRKPQTGHLDKCFGGAK